MRVLVLGVSGMLGSAVFREFYGHAAYDVYGLVRNPAFLPFFSLPQQHRLIVGVDVLDTEALTEAVNRVQPHVIINCVGLIKQKDRAEDPLVVLPINAMLPHRLAELCEPRDIRLLHISTDCVFSGRKGLYTEVDPSDAEDLYGKSKYMGELRDLSFAVTLRTSIVGHELDSKCALVDWFLSQQRDVVPGFRRSIFSGITAIELARIMRDVVLCNPSLNGLYNVSSAPISKFELLLLVAAQYGKAIEVRPDDSLLIDRSLDSSKFQNVTGYRPPSWESMVRTMHETKKQS